MTTKEDTNVIDLDTLLDQLPSSPEELTAGGFTIFRGQLKTAEVEKDATYGPQVRLDFTTPDTKSGKMSVWWGLGKNFMKTRKVNKNSKYGIALTSMKTLIGAPVKFGDYIGKWFVMENTRHDLGDIGVIECWTPQYVGDECPDEGTVPGSAGEDTWEGYSKKNVREALGLMHESNIKDFKLALAKSDNLKGSNIQNDVVSGEFIEKVKAAGFVEESEEGTYEVVGMPD